MDIQLYRDAVHANYAMLDSNPPTRRLLVQLEREGFTPQDVVDYLRWSEDVTGEHDSAYNRERMFRVRQRVLLRQEAELAEQTPTVRWEVRRGLRQAL
jgi:hypothetical protein